MNDEVRISGQLKAADHQDQLMTYGFLNFTPPLISSSRSSL